MNSTSDVEELKITLVAVDFWIFTTGVANIVINCLILYGLIKSKLFRPVYILIFHITILDIIQQLFCPTVFKLFESMDNIVKDFTNHERFQAIYFASLYLIVVLMFLLLFRIYFKSLDKYLVYELIVFWIIAILIIVLLVLTGSPSFVFLPPYILILAILLVHVHVHQIRTTLKFAEYSGVDYQVSLLIVLTFTSSRLIGLLLYIALEITYHFKPQNAAYFILGALQLVSLANLLLVAKFEVDFYNNIRFICRRRRYVDDNFRQLEEDHGLPE